MNGWEITCVVTGIVTMVCATHWYEVLAGFVCVIAPLYFSFWR